MGRVARSLCSLCVVALPCAHSLIVYGSNMHATRTCRVCQKKSKRDRRVAGGCTVVIHLCHLCRELKSATQPGTASSAVNRR